MSDSDYPFDAPGTALVAPTASLPPELESLIERAGAYARRRRAESTDRAYRTDWSAFSRWCGARGLTPLPATPGTLALYLTDCAARCKVGTLARRFAAVRCAHREAGTPLDVQDATLRSVWKGIRREHGAPPVTKAAAETAIIREMVAACPADTLRGLRDRAVLLAGFAGAFRRSELVSLDVRHLQAVRDGYIVTLDRSKTDQEGAGVKKGLPYGGRPETCPVRALRDWLAAAGIGDGPVFRRVDRHGNVGRARLSDRAVALIVQRAAAAAGVEGDFAGHSLRAGLVTSAAAAGVSLPIIMKQTGHSRADTLARYVRLGTLFSENAASRVGL